jgi:maleate isomerase
MPTLLGILTPSSNTALEPLTMAMLAGLPDITVHFSRFPVTRISLEPEDLSQFDDRPILKAARLLADARVDAIGWSGTSAGWLGFERDRALCERITEATGIPATSSILALNDMLQQIQAQTFGLVSPYEDAVQERIIAQYREWGTTCVAESHLGIRDNFQFSEVDETTLSNQVRTVAAASPQVIVPYCTNLKAAHLASSWDKEHHIPVLDTTTTVVWKLLRLAGQDPTRLRGWGQLFQKLR